uniref:PDEase domain-containing protein n=1 Tax=Coccolithus braarudii TaxID=221442 RepID=A0A7S0LSS2_9EUKA
MGVRQETLQNFLQGLENGYNDVPYHNSAHAACVCHSVHWILTNNREVAALSERPIELFAAVLAAMAHDMNHSGHNNAFHVASASDLAMLYSDQSVLEMHHLNSIFQLLKLEECALLAKLSVERRKEVRDTIISMVLATDLAVNFPTINEFKAMLNEWVPPDADGPERTTTRPPARTRRQSMKMAKKLSIGGLPLGVYAEDLFSAHSNTITKKEKTLILKMILKVSDISNVTKGKSYTLAWTERVVQEFFDQGDLEATLSLPVTPMMDRNTACVPKQQIGFYNFVAKPMFEVMDLLVPMEHALSNLAGMYQHWETLIPTEAKAAVSAPRRESEFKRLSEAPRRGSRYSHRGSKIA